ncbi:MAG TPA: flagellar basal-body rod protein FlgF [Burkholderiales bacterium]|nr:flagellar basal-body rod protein FlgF [Burkholderiales bacterium]
MDRMIYLAMSGAKNLLDRLAVTSNNLANASTAGFRAETQSFRAVHVQSDTLPTRTFALEATTGADLTPGPLMATGRALDVAVEGKGWIAVQLADGSEAYTRNGSLQIDENGVLQTRNGFNVSGGGGPISIPANTEVTIGGDGTVTSVPTSNFLNQTTPIGRIKLVNPDEADLERGADGLFRLRGGGEAEVDARVKLSAKYLEGSNVNPSEALVEMIAIARQFDTQMKLMQSADSNAQQATKLYSMS